MEYTVLIHPAEEGGYWAEVPALPGCFTQGETIDQTLENARDAIESHVACLREEGRETNGDEGFFIGRVKVAA